MRDDDVLGSFHGLDTSSYANYRTTTRPECKPTNACYHQEINSQKSKSAGDLVHTTNGVASKYSRSRFGSTIKKPTTLVEQLWVS